MGQFLSVAVAIGVPLAAGIGVGLTIQDDVKGWYKTLKKPNWTPPDWAFGPVWTALYAAMGYASYIVWNNGGGSLPLTLYGVQLVLNLAWSPIFFKKKEIGFALLDITALLGVLGATIIEFKKVSPTAAYLLLPYLAWTTYATALTASIYKNNPKSRGKESDRLRKQAEDAASSAADKASELSSVVQDKASELSDKVQNKDAGDKAGDKAKETTNKAGSKAEEATNKAGSKAEEATNKAKDAGSDAKGAAKDAGRKAEGGAKEAGNKVSEAASGTANDLKGKTA